MEKHWLKIRLLEAIQSGFIDTVEIPEFSGLLQKAPVRIGGGVGKDPADQIRTFKLIKRIWKQ